MLSQQQLEQHWVACNKVITTLRLIKEKNAEFTSEFLEEAVATYDKFIIEDVLNVANELGVKATTACLHKMIDLRAQMTEIALFDQNMRGAACDPSYSLYELQAKTVESLIKLGADVTPEILEKSIADENALKYIDGKPMMFFLNLKGEVNPTSATLKGALAKKEAEIRKNSQVLAQAYRTETGLFGRLPPERLVQIASLMGSNPEVIEDDKHAYEIAYKNFCRPQ